MPKMAEKWDCDVVHKTIKLTSAPSTKYPTPYTCSFSSAFC